MPQNLPTVLIVAKARLMALLNSRRHRLQTPLILPSVVPLPPSPLLLSPSRVLPADVSSSLSIDIENTREQPEGKNALSKEPSKEQPTGKDIFSTLPTELHLLIIDLLPPKDALKYRLLFSPFNSHFVEELLKPTIAPAIQTVWISTDHKGLARFAGICRSPFFADMVKTIAIVTPLTPEYSEDVLVRCQRIIEKHCKTFKLTHQEIELHWDFCELLFKRYNDELPSDSLLMVEKVSQIAKAVSKLTNLEAIRIFPSDHGPGFRAYLSKSRARDFHKIDTSLVQIRSPVFTCACDLASAYRQHDELDTLLSDIRLGLDMGGQETTNHFKWNIETDAYLDRKFPLHACLRSTSTHIHTITLVCGDPLTNPKSLSWWDFIGRSLTLHTLRLVTRSSPASYPRHRARTSRDIDLTLCGLQFGSVQRLEIHSTRALPLVLSHNTLMCFLARHRAALAHVDLRGCLVRLDTFVRDNERYTDTNVYRAKWVAADMLTVLGDMRLLLRGRGALRSCAVVVYPPVAERETTATTTTTTVTKGDPLGGHLFEAAMRLGVVVEEDGTIDFGPVVTRPESEVPGAGCEVTGTPWEGHIVTFYRGVNGINTIHGNV